MSEPTREEDVAALKTMAARIAANLKLLEAELPANRVVKVLHAQANTAALIGARLLGIDAAELHGTPGTVNPDSGGTDKPPHSA